METTLEALPYLNLWTLRPPLASPPLPTYRSASPLLCSPLSCPLLSLYSTLQTMDIRRLVASTKEATHTLTPQEPILQPITLRNLVTRWWWWGSGWWW